MEHVYVRVFHQAKSAWYQCMNCDAAPVREDKLSARQGPCSGNQMETRDEPVVVAPRPRPHRWARFERGTFFSVRK